jgi:hypothetical protein
VPTGAIAQGPRVLGSGGVGPVAIGRGGDARAFAPMAAPTVARPAGRGTFDASLTAGQTGNLLWQNTTTGDRGFWAMSDADPAGGWTPLTNIATAWRIACTADFDGDGSFDILWQNTSTGDWGFWLLNGTTASATGYIPLTTIATTWSVVGCADVSADGKPDLLWRSSATGDMGFWKMNGTAPDGSGYSPLTTIAAVWEVAALADFSGDGKPDILWQNLTTGDRGFWTLNGTSPSGTGWIPLTVIAGNWKIRFAADGDSDGDADIVWQNTSTGERGWWFLAGTTVSAGWRPLTTIAGEWDMVGILPLGGGPITAQFCPPDVPLWVGMQSGSGAWAQVPLVNDAISVNFPQRGGIAFVFPQGSGFSIEVIYATAAEFRRMAGGASCTAGDAKMYTGSVAGLTTGEYARIQVGQAGTNVFFPGTTFSINQVPPGPQDLVASRIFASMSGPGTPLKTILRRGVNQGTGTALAQLDFGAAEAFTPASATLTVGNAGSDGLNVNVDFQTTNSVANAFQSQGGSGTATWYGIPSGKLLSGDMHAVMVNAFPASGSDMRAVGGFWHTVANQSLTLGPTLSTPTISELGTDPYLRHRFQVASQAEYPDGVAATVMQQDNASSFYRELRVNATRGYVGSTPATWDLSVPDFGSGAGFNPTWAPQSGQPTTLDVLAFGGELQFERGTEGATWSFALHEVAPPAAMRAGERRLPSTNLPMRRVKP